MFFVFLCLSKLHSECSIVAAYFNKLKAVFLIEITGCFIGFARCQHNAADIFASEMFKKSMDKLTAETFSLIIGQKVNVKMGRICFLIFLMKLLPGSMQSLQRQRLTTMALKSVTQV